MKGFETAFFGVCGTPPDLKQSKAGKPYCSFSVGVDIGEDRAGKAQTEWARVTVFGDVAERLAATLQKGDRLYCEGALTPNRWTAENGEVRFSLNIAAFKAEKVGASAIGRNKPKRDHDSTSKPQAAQGAEQFDDAIPF
jgi:single-strand DNA-binding protein